MNNPLKVFKCVKYTVFTINFIFFVLGLAVLAFGLYARFHPDATNYVASLRDQGGTFNAYFIAVYGVIVAGGLMTLFGFLGCCGAFQESRIMLGIFCFLLIIVIAAEIFAGVYGIHNQSLIEGKLNETLKNSMQKDYMNEKRNSKAAIDWLQETLECCGALSASDWQSAEHIKKPPASCCRSKTETCTATAADFFSQPCGYELSWYLKTHLWIIIIVGFVLAFLQLLGLALSIGLFCLLMRIDRYRSYVP